jgi:hypothetical protein
MVQKLQKMNNFAAFSHPKNTTQYPLIKTKLTPATKKNEKQCQESAINRRNNPNSKDQLSGKSTQTQ